MASKTISPCSPCSATTSAELETQFIDSMSISHRFTIECPTAGSNVLSTKFSQDGKMLVVSYADGTVNLHNSYTGDVINRL